VTLLGVDLIPCSLDEKGECPVVLVSRGDLLEVLSLFTPGDTRSLSPGSDIGVYSY